MLSLYPLLLHLTPLELLGRKPIPLFCVLYVPPIIRRELVLCTKAAMLLRHLILLMDAVTQKFDSFSERSEEIGRMKKETSAKFTTLDSYVAGYLTLRGFQPELVDQGGKVVFVFESCDGLNQAKEGDVGPCSQTRCVLRDHFKSTRKGFQRAHPT